MLNELVFTYAECYARTLLLILAIREGVKLLATKPFRALGAKVHWPSFPECGAPDESSQIYMECLVRMAALTMYHPVGTSAMGSVVDSQLR